MKLTTEITSAHALITEMFSIIDEDRWNDLATVFAAGCVCLPARSEPVVGLEMIERYYRHDRVVASGQHHIDGLASDLSVAACWGTFTGVARNGQPISEAFAEALAVRDGKIVWRSTYLRPRLAQ